MSHAPLAEPEVLRECFKPFTALLLPHRLVDFAQDPLGGPKRALRQRAVFVRFRVLYDLFDEQRISRYALHCGVIVGGGMIG